MQREIKFRGKDIDSGQWVYGYYWHNIQDDQHLIINSVKLDIMVSGQMQKNAKVSAGTLGQLTGLKDKNGVEIYEGDLVKEYIMDDVFQVVFSDYANFGLKPVSKVAVNNLKGHEYETIDPSYSETSLTIIGNATDNPDLLS